MLKLILVGIGVVAVFALFSSEINSYFPNVVTTGVDSFKQDASSLASSSVESVQDRIDSSSQSVRENIFAAADQTVRGAENQLGSAADTIGQTLGLG